MSQAATAARSRVALAALERAANAVTRHVVVSLCVIVGVQVIATSRSSSR